MTLKIFFGSLSLIVALVSFAPYLKDILARKTTPHMYSWLVWTILQATATIAILRENLFWSALGVAALGLVSGIVFLLSFKYGTKNITTFDTACLIGALIAIGIWVFAHNVTLSIILITIIDFVGFLPTYRKGYEEPYSETIFLYVCSAFSNFFSFLSLTQYSIESSLYVVSLVVSNVIFVSIVFTRRRLLSQETDLDA
jgi:hypothetical protein